jgi:hypothetical protein
MQFLDEARNPGTLSSGKPSSKTLLRLAVAFLDAYWTSSVGNGLYFACQSFIHSGGHLSDGVR